MFKGAFGKVNMWKFLFKSCKLQHFPFLQGHGLSLGSSITIERFSLRTFHPKMQSFTSGQVPPKTPDRDVRKFSLEKTPLYPRIQYGVSWNLVMVSWNLVTISWNVSRFHPCSNTFHYDDAWEKFFPMMSMIEFLLTPLRVVWLHQGCQEERQLISWQRWWP